MWHLDSNIVIGFLNGQKNLDEKVQAHLDALSVSSLVVAELLFGARNSARAAKNLARLHRFLDLVEVVDFDAACADTYSHIRLSRRKKGKPTGEMDLLIASVAITHNATLVTHNLKHYMAIVGLKLEDWLGGWAAPRWHPARDLPLSPRQPQRPRLGHRPVPGERRQAQRHPRRPQPHRWQAARQAAATAADVSASTTTAPLTT